MPQPTAHHGPTTTSILMLIAVIIFVVSLGGAVFSYLGQIYLLNVQKQSKLDLTENEKRFNTSRIEDLQKANAKIDLAKQLLRNHVAVSEALNIVAGLTAEKVYFTDFEFDAPDNFGKTADTAGTFKIKMKGVADSFNSIAFQSEVFGKSEQYGTNKMLKNPILSDMTVDDKNNVKFNFSADLNTPDISYEKELGLTDGSETNTADSTTTSELPTPDNTTN
jgi:hypothetical protein